MNKENKKYLIEDGRWVKATKWRIFKQKIKSEIKRWKLVDRYANRIIPSSELKRYFSLSPKELKDAEKIYKEKGTISYEFYPCAGIGWGVKVKVIKTGEIIDITDVTCW